MNLPGCEKSCCLSCSLVEIRLEQFRLLPLQGSRPVLLRESAAKPRCPDPDSFPTLTFTPITKSGEMEKHLEPAVSEAAGRLVPAPMVLEDDKSVANHLVALNFVGC